MDAAPDTPVPEEALRRTWLPGPLVRALALLLLVAVVASGVASAWLMSRTSEPQAVRRILDQDGGEVEMLARMLSSKIEQNLKLLATVADGVTPAVLNSTPKLRTWLLQGRQVGRVFDSVVVLKVNGASGLRLQGDRVESVAAISGAEQEVLQRVRANGKPMVSGVLGDTAAQAQLLLALPVLDDAGGVTAVVVGALRLQSQSLLPPALALPVRDDTRFVVFSRDGIILSHPDPARVLGPLRDEPELGGLFMRNGAVRSPVVPGKVVLADGSVVGWAVVGLPQWVVVRVNHSPALLQPLVAAEQRAWWLAGAGMALVALLGLGALWWLMHPLTLLRQRARAVLAGEHPASVPWSEQRRALANGEVDDVVRVFGRLVQLRRQQLRNALVLSRHLDAVLEQVPLGIALTRAQRIELVSGEACRLLGYDTSAQLVGRDLLQLVSSAPDGADVLERVRADFAAHGSFHGELPLARSDGATFWARVQGAAVRLDGPIEGVVWVLEDGSAEREARLQHDWERWNDTLTFLPNRAALERRLQLLLSERVGRGARANATLFPEAGALLHIDIDHFTLINELAGHASGDDVLRHLARLLQAQVRQMGWVARLGGDEFAVVLPGANVHRATALADQLRRVVAGWEPTYHGRSFSMSLSIGLVMLMHDAAVADVLSRADMACYVAKRAGRNRVEVKAVDAAQPGASPAATMDAASSSSA
ncbi:diguanylate cyclase [Comamonas sp. SCN 65-56]|uniref:sensor domain-containing diguanylate cyclase n=1 Tax=Comamonas sp. SCN 65-56 TaxID=1660095 RepID=UPI000ADB9E4E|nr:diguanylate cyclase [Comamonas sp. SCN 65-56]